MNEALLTVASLLLASYGALWWRMGKLEQVHKNLNLHLDAVSKEVSGLKEVITELKKTVANIIIGK